MYIHTRLLLWPKTESPVSYTLKETCERNEEAAIVDLLVKFELLGWYWHQYSEKLPSNNHISNGTQNLINSPMKMDN